MLKICEENKQMGDKCPKCGKSQKDVRPIHIEYDEETGDKIEYHICPECGYEWEQ